MKISIKKSAWFSLLLLCFALADNGKHMFLSYEMLHPSVKDSWVELITAILSIVVLEAAILKFTIKGYKGLALYFAIATGMITSAYLMSGVYETEHALNFTFWKSAFLAALRTSMYMSIPYVISEFISDEIEILDNTAHLESEVERLAIYEKGMTNYEKEKKEHEDLMTNYEKEKNRYKKEISEYENHMTSYENSKKEYETNMKKYEEVKNQHEELMKNYEDVKKEHEEVMKEVIKLRAEVTLLRPLKTTLERAENSLKLVHNTYVSRGSEYYHLKVNPNTHKIEYTVFAKNLDNKPKHLIDNLLSPPLLNGVSKNVNN